MRWELRDTTVNLHKREQKIEALNQQIQMQNEINEQLYKELEVTIQDNPLPTVPNFNQSNDETLLMNRLSLDS